MGQGQAWYGVCYEHAANCDRTIGLAGHHPALTPRLRFTAEEGLSDMDEQGVDMQVISMATPLLGYDRELDRARRLVLRTANNVPIPSFDIMRLTAFQQV